MDHLAPDQRCDHANLAHAAMIRSPDAYLHVANRNIQIHGGMGFTWEHSAHHLPQAREVLFGIPGFHRERMAVSLEFGIA